MLAVVIIVKGIEMHTLPNEVTNEIIRVKQACWVHRPGISTTTVEKHRRGENQDPGMTSHKEYQ